jgi:hypothetical protein
MIMQIWSSMCTKCMIIKLGLADGLARPGAKLLRECAKWLNAPPALTSVAHQANRLAAVSEAAAVGRYRVLSLAARPAGESGPHGSWQATP